MAALGVVIPMLRESDLVSDLANQAKLAEAAGADSLWVDDHLAQIDGAQSRYPFSPDGEPTWPVTASWWECLTSLAYIAAVTERCTVGTAVLVLPQRNVIQLAKSTATLDLLSGGRLVLGFGVGWLAEEMEALGWSFRKRGKRADEMLDALRACWTGRPDAIDGEHVTLPEGLVMHPKPLQKPGPPILIGGMSAAAGRRAAERGDGWLALATEEMLDLDALAAQAALIDELRAAGPRAGEPFRRTLLFPSWPEDVDALIKNLRTFADLGFDELILEPDWADPDACAAAIAAIRGALDE